MKRNKSGQTETNDRFQERQLSREDTDTNRQDRDSYYIIINLRSQILSILLRISNNKCRFGACKCDV